MGLDTLCRLVLLRMRTTHSQTKRVTEKKKRNTYYENSIVPIANKLRMHEEVYRNIPRSVHIHALYIQYAYNFSKQTTSKMTEKHSKRTNE